MGVWGARVYGMLGSRKVDIQVWGSLSGRGLGVVCV